jgi:peptidyl-prolyl cis-trans isomerase D
MVYEQSDSLKPVADKLKLEIKTADKLARQPLPGVSGVLASEKFLSALFAADTLSNKRNTEAIETAANQLVAGRVVLHQPARTLPLTEVKMQVQAQVVAARAAELAQKEGAEKLALWQAGAAPASLSAAQIVSRDQSLNLPAPVLLAALRADTAKLPAWAGVDLGSQGYALVRVNRVVPREAAAQASLVQSRGQYAQWWSGAESQAYYVLLKEKLKAEILVSNPVKKQ